MNTKDSQSRNFSNGRDKKNAAWGVANQITNILAQGLLLVFASYLDARNLNVWLLLLSFNSLLSAIPLSLESIILRNLQGIDSDDYRFTKFEMAPIANIESILVFPRESAIKSIKEIAKLIGFLGFLAYFLLVLIYILSTQRMYSSSIFISILCMSVSIFALGPSTYYRSRLRTFNHGHLISQVQIISRLTILLVFSLTYVFDLGVLAFAIAYSFGWVLEMIILKFLERKIICSGKVDNAMNYAMNMKKIWDAMQEIYKKNLIVALSSFTLIRGTCLIAGIWLGDSLLSQFLMTQQLISVLSNVSAEFIRQGAPKFNFLQLQDDRRLIRRYYRQVLLLTLLLYSFGSLCLAFYSIVNLRGNFPLVLFEGFELYVLLIAGALELNTICATSYLASKNQVLHAYSYLLSSIVTIGVVFLTSPKFGLNSFILVPILIQISYNHWKWPLKVFRDLQSNAN